jgi:flagellar biosynthesis anti-sigma factor FlgM
MRIGFNSADPQSVSTEQAQKSSTAAINPSEVSSTGDKSGISQDRVTLSALATQALGTPEMRQDQVDSLRQSISSGQYQLDPGGIADAILGNQQNC